MYHTTARNRAFSAMVISGGGVACPSERVVLHALSPGETSGPPRRSGTSVSVGYVKNARPSCAIPFDGWAG
jgi:hypothetical protein